MKVILASSSPRRKDLLKQIGVDFSVFRSDFDDDEEIKLTDPILKAKKSAETKAAMALHKAHNEIVVGADTVIILKNEVLGKPHSKEEAICILQKLNGRSHTVVTAFAIMKKANGSIKKIVDYEKTEVYFRRLGKQEILEYIETGECLDKAGAYGIQGFGAVLVKKIDGCYSNVVGLPLARLSRALHELEKEDKSRVVKVKARKKSLVSS